MPIFRIFNFVTGFGFGFCSGVVWSVGSMYYVEYVPKMYEFVKNDFRFFEKELKMLEEVKKDFEAKE